MEFVFRSKLNNIKSLKDFDLDISNLTISKNHNSYQINNNFFNLFLCFKKDSNLEKYYYADDDYVILMSHHIKNTDQIKKSCKSMGEHGPKIMLDYFKKFGKKLFKELKGEFSILIFNKKSQKIISGIDRFGLKQLFCYSDNNSFILSTRLSMILNLDHLLLSLNKVRLNDFLESKILSHEYTFYNEIFKIKPSHYITNSGNIYCDQTRYFNFQSIVGNSYTSLEKASLSIKDALINSIFLKINKNKNIGVMFSGGLDSSSIISILASKNIYKIHGISAVFKNIPVKNINLINESSYQNNIYDKFKNINKYQFDASNSSILEDIDRYIGIIGEPFFFPNLYLADKSYEYAHKNNLSLVFNGNDGDTIISHGYEVLFYYFISFKWLKLYKELKLVSAKRGVGIIFTFKRLVVDLYMQPFIIQFINKYLKIFSKKNDLQRKIFINPKKNHINTIQSTLHQDSIYKHSCLAFYYGIEEAYPFYDADFISCSLKVPSKYKLMKGMPRFILRDAMKDYLPKENLERMTKSNLAFALCMNLKNKREIIEYEIENINPYLLKHIDLINLKDDWELIKSSPYSHAVRSDIPSKLLKFLVLNKWFNNHSNKYFKADINLTNS